jgi:O-antigen ligase
MERRSEQHGPFGPVRRFPALRFLAGLLKVVVVLVFVLALAYGWSRGVVVAMGGLAVVVSLVVWANAELIDVLIAIEENTRSPHLPPRP